MKYRKTYSVSLILVILFIFGNVETTNAQLLKKLKNRVEDAAKEAAIRKAEEMAARKAEKSVEKLFSINLTKKSMNPEILPESYEFEYKYKLQMKTNKGKMNMVYFLKPEATYFGSTPEISKSKKAGNMLMVLDEALNTTTIFMEAQGKKMGHIVPLQDTDDDNEEQLKNSQFKELGTKTILGYECQGFTVENNEMKIIMYVAFDAPVSFNQIFKDNNTSKTLPKGFNKKWLEMAESSLVMEMQFINKENKKFNTEMTCIGLEAIEKTVQISDYEFMKTETAQPTFEE